MTQGLYELLGADQRASHDALRTAYTRAVAQLVRRRRAIIEQGGDASTLDLRRAQVDEAWAVLADPVRRRRYDALLALSDAGDLPAADALWDQVAGAVVRPSAAVAVQLARALTELDLGDLPPAVGAPEADPTEIDPDRPARPDTQADVPTESYAPRARHVDADPPSVVPFPRAGGQPRRAPREGLRVVEGRGDGASVVRLSMPSPSTAPPEPDAPSAPRVDAGPSGATPSGGPPRAARTPIDPEALVAEHGWSGALLQRVRESRGMTLRDMGDATRISARYLEAIEADQYDQLPSSTFVKGYLREMARTLGLDESALVKGYMRRMSG